MELGGSLGLPKAQLLVRACARIESKKETPLGLGWPCGVVNVLSPELCLELLRHDSARTARLDQAASPSRCVVPRGGARARRRSW
eukprot:3919618-Pyramimonas_sp.AAC.1